MAQDVMPRDAGWLPIPAIDGNRLVVAEEGELIGAERRGHLPFSWQAARIEVMDVAPNAKIGDLQADVGGADGQGMKWLGTSRSPSCEFVADYRATVKGEQDLLVAKSEFDLYGAPREVGRKRSLEKRFATQSQQNLLFRHDFYLESLFAVEGGQCESALAGGLQSAGKAYVADDI